MPLLGKLITLAFASLYGVIASLFGAYWAVRITAALTLGTIYLACVIAWAAYAIPLLATIFSTAWGAVLGLFFPPIAGTLMAGLSAYWVCVAGKRYTAKLLKMAIG